MPFAQPMPGLLLPVAPAVAPVPVPAVVPFAQPMPGLPFPVAPAVAPVPLPAAVPFAQPMPGLLFPVAPAVVPVPAGFSEKSTHSREVDSFWSRHNAHTRKNERGRKAICSRKNARALCYGRHLAVLSRCFQPKSQWHSTIHTIAQLKG